MAKKKKIKVRSLIVLATLSVVFIFSFVSILSLFSKNKKHTVSTKPFNPASRLISQFRSQEIGNDVSSESAFLINPKTQHVIAQKNADQRVYPASMTKIMTAVLIMEKVTDYNEMITIPQSIIDETYIAGASVAGFLPGESLSVTDLLYGVLLPSGTEATFVLIDHFYPSREEFVKEMNLKAASLHMDSTNFLNGTGLHEENHYTTTSDMAKLLEYALTFDMFKQISSTPYYVTQGSNLAPEGHYIESTIFSKISSSEFKNGKLLGGKTGSTPQAGLNLASYATFNNNTFILVTAKAEDLGNNEPTNIYDALHIYDTYLNK